MSLFEPLTLRGVTLKNRIAVSPMCQYSATDGKANTWHLVHLGSRSIGGAGLVMAEASAVTAEGRISPSDAGIWNDAHVQSWGPVAGFLHHTGTIAGIQLAHAGRKASTTEPWNGSHALDPDKRGWRPVIAPSPIEFSDKSPLPKAMDRAAIDKLVEDFAAAARRALAAGFKVIELHAAHGYLLHSFLSPISNQRTDDYGGSFENRIRLLRRVIAAVRKVWPENLPLFVRISATDWAEPGVAAWDLEQSCALVEAIKNDGVDLIDVSSGGSLPKAQIPIGPGFQTPFAATIRQRTGVMTSAVGLITSPEQADHIIRSGQADVVMLAREMLRDPYWPRRAAEALNVKLEAPVQYARAW